MTPTRAALLRDVVQAIIDDGYAELPQPPETRRRNGKRKAQIEVLSYDPRLMRRSNVNIDLVTYVTRTYRVSRGNARMMLHRARKVAEVRKETKNV